MSTDQRRFLPNSDKGSLVLFFDKRFHFRRLVGFDQFLEHRVGLVFATNGDHAGVRRFAVFEQEGIGLRRQPRHHSVIGIHRRDVDVVQRPGNLRCFQLFDLEVFRVGDDVLGSGLETRLGIQFDQPGFFQEQQPDGRYC